ncbi:MAG: CrcB family protein [Opitutales bacterium]|nr:CrcB family protein [Opitutales bacterium]
MNRVKTILNFIYVRQLHFSAVALGGALGALTRTAICSIFESQILAVFICNVLGSFLLSIAIELRRHIHPDIENMVSVGFCGGLSIFATFSKDSVQALADEQYLIFVLNLFGNFTICVLTVFLAHALATYLRNHRNWLRKRRRAISQKLKLSRKAKTR